MNHAATLSPIHIEYAVSEILGDVEHLTEWLAQECDGATSVTSDHELRQSGRLKDASVATLLHAMIVSADRSKRPDGVMRDGYAASCLEAAQLLVQRYLVHRDADMHRIAAGIAVEEEA